MFDREQLRLSRAYRAVHEIPLWPGFAFVSIPTADDRGYLDRMAELCGETTVKLAAHEAILAERAFLDSCTDAEYAAIYEVAA